VIGRRGHEPEPSEATTRALQKQVAAERAVEFVESGMTVGLGTGSTAMHAVRCIGAMLRRGALRDLLAVPTSAATESEARQLGIPIAGAEWTGAIDVTIDGADEVDDALDLIKGAGGALLREKIVAQASLREIIVIDETKLSPMLGTHRLVPVEVLEFGRHSQARFLESLGARVIVRTRPDGTLFETDQGNLILDCEFGPVAQPAELASILASRAGIVEHGLFIGLATDIIVAGTDGVTHRTRPDQSTLSVRGAGRPS
jgi:ribose 5-phosphate isomerase A